MDLPTLQARIREHLAGRHDVRVALLFGSRARATARPDSDVDLAVEAPEVDLLPESLWHIDSGSPGTARVAVT